MLSMRSRLAWAAAVAVGFATAAASTPSPSADWQFRLMGIGGGGGIFTPGISPDGQVMFTASDMGGSFRSVDGGQTWEMIHHRQMSNSLSAQPHFTSEGVLWSTGRSLRFSADQGETWTPLTTGSAPWNQAITHIHTVSNPTTGATQQILVGTSEGLWRSSNNGASWTSVQSGATRSVVALGQNVYAAVGNTLRVSSNGGATWQTQSTGGLVFREIAGGSDGSANVLFGIVDNQGTFRSTDGGVTWQNVDVHRNFRHIMMPHNQTNVIYATHSNRSADSSPIADDHFDTVYRSTDGGATWQRAFRMQIIWGGAPQEPQANVDPRAWVQTDLGWGYYITNRGVTVSPTNPNLLSLTTQGEIYHSNDGGATWYQGVNQIVTSSPQRYGSSYASIGLEVSGASGPRSRYLFDPHDGNRTYMTYNDFGFIRSTDRGETWIPANRGSGSWGNTYYDVQFDPVVPGRMYTAASSRHDIPHWTHITPNTSSHLGGVLVSNDYGANWQALGSGLPNRPTTSIVIDPATMQGPASGRTFYVSVFGEGVYKSTNGGSTWVQKNNGLGHAGNMHVVQVDIHRTTGDIYAAITANRQPPGTEGGQFPYLGGIWRSTNGADSWQEITAGLGMRWITSFLLDPHRQDTIWFTSAEPAGWYPTAFGTSHGGLYRSDNGGQTWQHVLNNAVFAATGGASFTHAMNISAHPTDPNWLFLGTSSHGLWASDDGGANWWRVEEFPFGGAGAVEVDPLNPHQLYVATFGGGIWQITIPEPASLSLLGLAYMMLLRRRAASRA